MSSSVSSLRPRDDDEVMVAEAIWAAVSDAVELPISLLARGAGCSKGTVTKLRRMLELPIEDRVIPNYFLLRRLVHAAGHTMSEYDLGSGNNA